ncbi:MAG TPA: methyltransferase domain-containing protein [Bryobacteraceae bacterium]|nr:methyltransferase domain-containing protein [Bryobacteraceae bacterium]
MNELTFKASEAHKLEDPERFNWLPPDEILAQVGLRPGMIVADIGSGTGFFAIPMARVVGASGRVYAVDFQDEMLDLLRAKLAAPDAPANLEPLKGEAVATGLPDQSCDLVFTANTWHELEDRPSALREFARILKPDGILAVLDWRHDADRPPGPPAAHRIPMRDAIATLEHQGWELHHFGKAGTYTYLLLAGVADQGQQS